MVYINDNDFVHSVYYTIEKRVYDVEIKKKLHQYFTKNTHHMDYDLFLIFSRVIGELDKIYNNCKYSNSFILVLLTYLHESARVLNNADVISAFLEKFLKKVPESEIVTIDCTEYYNQFPREFECLRYLTLTSKLQMFIYNNGNNNGNNANNERYSLRRAPRRIYNEEQQQQERRSERRSRSRSSQSRRNQNQNQNQNPNPNRVYAPHVTQEKRLEMEQSERVLQQQPIQQNPDAVIFRLVQDNHSLSNAIYQRDIMIRKMNETIQQLSNELLQYRRHC